MITSFNRRRLKLVQQAGQVLQEKGLFDLPVDLDALAAASCIHLQAMDVNEEGVAAAIDDELLAIARDSELARRLMTVPGVGPIVALGFIATVDDVSRFAKATDVGAYLGLTPRRYQSGEMDYSGRICGR